MDPWGTPFCVIKTFDDFQSNQSDLNQFLEL